MKVPQNRPALFSLFCIFVLTGVFIYTWATLPDMDRYPIHWNAAGEADGFAGRNGVLGILLIMPITLIFNAALMYFLPKIEPLRKNLEASRSAYDTIWMLLIAFLTIIGVVICSMYWTDSETPKTLGIQLITIGTSLLFMGIGNVLGKMRQNYMVGIRTPWTLASDLSWEKTHRLGGRLFVLSGAIGVIAALLSPAASIIALVSAILLSVIICAVYSYLIWKDDPHKRS
jgi:uncharacterized membrane protein